MHGTCLTFGKPFVKKQYNVLIFLIDSAKYMEVPIELSEDCYYNLSVPIPNEQTLPAFRLIVHDFSLGAKYFFEYLLHPLVRKLFLHLKEATLHLQ